MTTKQTGDKFYQGATKGHANNVFIEGDTLYSYGHHFPLCVRIAPEIYAWNEDRYSVTTSKHQSQCYPHGVHIIPGNTEVLKNWSYFKQYGGDENKAGTVNTARAYLARMIAYCTEKQQQARSDSKREYWHGEAMRYQQAGHMLQSI